MKQEIEVKLPLASSPDMARRLLEESGARVERERAFEDNTLYDDAPLSLGQSGRLLRLRRTKGPDGDWEKAAKITYKQPVEERGGKNAQGRYKILSEIEMSVTDPDAFDSILGKLGFSPVYRYQKYRTAFRLGGVEVTLDETPIGNYLELEGDQQDIDALAVRLGYRPEDYINISYRALQQRTLAGTGRENEDMLFDLE
jgi:adenylate cyclase class 2